MVLREVEDTGRVLHEVRPVAPDRAAEKATHPILEMWWKTI
jgi:hypothetical protein